MKIFLKFILVFLLFFFQLLASQNQKELDSLLNVYRTQKNDTSKLTTLSQLFQLTIDNDLEKAHKYVNVQLSLAKKLNDQNGIYNAQYNYGIYLTDDGLQDSAKTYFLSAKQYWTQTNQQLKLIKVNNSLAKVDYLLGKSDSSLSVVNTNLKLIDSLHGTPIDKGDAYKIRGKIYQSFGKLDQALEDFLKAAQIYEQANSKLKNATALDEIGYLEGLLGNFKKSIEYTVQAAKVYKALNQKRLLSRAYGTIGAANVYLKNMPEAKKSFEKSMEIAKESGSINTEANAYENLGGFLIDSKEFQKGIPMLQKSLQLRKQSDYKYKIAHVTMNIGLAYRDMKNYSKAISYLDEAEIDAKKIDNADGILQKINNYRSECYEAIGNFKEALTNYKTYKALNDSIFNKTKVQQIEKLRAEFDTKRKEQQIALQKKEISLLEQKEKNSRLQRLLLGIGLGFSLIIFGLLFYSIRQKMKRNKAEREKLDAELNFKKKELTTHALHLAKKNEVLEELKQKALQLKQKTAEKSGIQNLITTINFDLQDDSNWENFKNYFEQVHKDFSSKAQRKFPNITPNDLRLMALLKMNLSSKEIANILNISSDGIKKARQRLRKKLELDSDQSLEAEIIAI